MEKNVVFIPAKRELVEKRVAIYCRVSTSEVAQLKSLATQISGLVTEISQRGNWRLVEAYIDVASAKEHSPRIEFERMVKDCEAKKVDIVITKSMSRFGRDTIDALAAVRKMKAGGCRIIIEKEGIDTAELESELKISLYESLAQSENESNALNIRQGLSYKARRGTSGLYTRACYGYRKTKDGELEIVDSEAKNVQLIYYLYLHGESINGILKKLEERKIASPEGKDKWPKHSVEKILEREKYTGTVILNDPMDQEHAFKKAENNPPIISESDFKQVQEERKRRSNMIDDGSVRQRKHTKYSSKKKAIK
jgi:Site-specific recombinases, DNA invertase Pin homologs